MSLMHCIALRHLKTDLFWSPEWPPFALLPVSMGVRVWQRELCSLQSHSFQFNAFIAKGKPGGESKD